MNIDEFKKNIVRDSSSEAYRAGGPVYVVQCMVEERLKPTIESNDLIASEKAKDLLNRFFAWLTYAYDFDKEEWINSKKDLAMDGKDWLIEASKKGFKL